MVTGISACPTGLMTERKAQKNKELEIIISAIVTARLNIVIIRSILCACNVRVWSKE